MARKSSVYLPAGRMLEHKPKNPERTGYRAVQASPSSDRFGDVEIKEFPTRAGMLLAIEMQSKANPSPFHWKEWRW